MKILLSALYEAHPLQFNYPVFETEKLFQIAKALGFDGIDYITTLPELFTAPLGPVQLSKRYKIPIIGIHFPLHLIFYTPPLLFSSLIGLYRNFPDCKVYNFHLSGFINHLQSNGKNLEKFISLAGKSTIPLSFESNPKLKGLQYWPKVTFDPKLFAEFCIKHDLPITFDTAHIAHYNFDIVKFFQSYYKQIKLIHLSDSIGAIQHLALGKGNLPIKELLQLIKKKRYQNYIAFEITHFSKEVSEKEKTSEIKKSLEMVKKYAF